MLDKNFCSFLEYHLSKSFKHSQDGVVKHFWCDGIMLPLNEIDYSKKVIDDKRELLLKAFLGKDGQDEYSMIILFGEKSLNYYSKGLDLKKCIPGFEKEDWYVVDEKLKQITIRLQ